MKPYVLHFDFQGPLINNFLKAVTQGTMDLHRRTDNFFSYFLKLIICHFYSNKSLNLLKSRFRLINCFSFTTFEILKYKCSQLVERCKKCLAMIHLSKFLYKSLQVGICCNHKSGDWYF